MSSVPVARELLRAKDLADARDPPTKQAYGIGTSFRDPSGNNIRLTQVLDFDPGRV